jgi:membrane associated rhomboid family serine protease
MLKPASLKEIPHCPVTTGLAAAAIVVTGMSWADKDISRFVMDVNVWQHWELWRAFTSIFPHVDILHIVFNVYWLWVFGTVVEHVFGHVRFLGIALLLAVVSALAEFSLFSGGVGLSGVGYGLWGMLWVLSWRDPRFAGVVDAKTSRVFIVWFFFCIALTVTGAMPIANAAHGMGAVMGALLGFTICGRVVTKAASIAGAVVISLLAVGGTTIWWPRVNQSGYAQTEIERSGVEALYEKNNTNAVRLLELSAHMKGAPARTWYNLGIAHQRLKENEQALAAYEQAAHMTDADDQIRKTAQDMKEYLDLKKRRF